jgi:hypothetical protein
MRSTSGVKSLARVDRVAELPVVAKMATDKNELRTELARPKANSRLRP